jgi:hypothetical protein
MKTPSIFSLGNTKLLHCAASYKLRLASFDLPAGHTCPMALLCHSRAVINSDGKAVIVDYGEFRCYAASTEVLWKNVRNVRNYNFELSKSQNFVDTINSEIARLGLTSIRVHSSGDFYTYGYMMKWIEIARLNPDVQFWGYTKMGTFLKILNAESNMNFVYSMGGMLDDYAIKNNLPVCRVVNNIEEAEELGLPVSCTPEHKSNDYEFIQSQKSFALVIHGMQKAGSKKRKIKTA